MTEPKVRVLGADRLARTLRSAASDIAEKRDLNARAAESMARAMRGRAPRDSGRLALSIATDSDDGSAAAYTSLLYGAVQEYGSPPKHISAQPFARPTLADELPDYVDALGDSIQKDLNRVKGA